jgi:hypothetical protein
VVATVALCFGRAVVDAVVGRRDVDPLTRWALAMPGLVLFAFVLMLLHLITGGLVFSNAWLTRGVTVATGVGLFVLNLWRRRGETRERLPRWQFWTVIGACLLGGVIWGYPIARVLPLNFGPDTNLHMGWATELMIGESSPSTVVTGHVPGSYPWLYHAVVAMLARFTPGGRAFDALGPLQLVQVVGGILGLFGVGRHMTNRFVTGAAAAFFGALSGGFGVGILFDSGLRRGVVDLPATHIPWLGDVLSRRPYNFAFNNVAPAYPRDLSFSLLVAFLLLLLGGLRRKRLSTLAGAGVVLGLVGLAGGEAVIVGSAVVLVVCLIQGEMPRIKAALAVLVPMGMVWGTWLVPVIINYIRYGGFVNTTHVGPVVLTFWYVVVSWGIVIPFALLGLAVSLRSLRAPAVLVPLAIVAITAVIMGSDAFPTVFGSAFLTLGRDHRYWALCQLGVALLGALGATVVVQRMSSQPRVAVALAAVVIFLGGVAPAFGSAIYPDRFPGNRLVGASLEGKPTLLNAMAPSAERRCVAAVAGNFLAREVFSYTGFRLVQWIDVPDRSNDARIRWRGIYTHIPDDTQREKDNQILTQGTGPLTRWRALAHAYGVNFVVVRNIDAGSAVFEGLDKRRFRLQQAPVTLVRVSPC